MSVYANLFSAEDLAYLTALPQVLEAKSRLETSKVVYFSIPLTATIRESLKERLGLDLANKSEIPMRWIKGDTPAHVDIGSTAFENTYLAYINESSGQFILGNDSYPIDENTAFVFHEGLRHETIGTGLSPRLLLGPMNEFASPVGAPPAISYYNNYADAYNQTGDIAIQYADYVLGNISSGNIGSYTRWKVAYVASIDPSLFPTGTYNNGFDLSTLGLSGAYSFYVYPSAPCFLEGTQVLCQIENVDTYVPIESIKAGTLVKTSLNGYKKVELIKKGTIQNPGNDARIENRLYKCTPAKYPGLVEDLYITGCHSILLDNFTELERAQTIKELGRVFITDKKYRLMAWLDERAEPWNSDGNYTIWHLALENADVKMNYGIYVNGGLLVETCSIDFLKNKSNMSEI
jgi:hypothetical protein